MINTDWLKYWSELRPQKLALYDVLNSREYSYLDFYKKANALSFYFKSRGVKKGDRVAVLTENKIETLFILFSLMRIGAVLVPINYRLSVTEVDYILSDSSPELLIYDDECKSTASKLCSDFDKIEIEEIKKILDKKNTDFKEYPFQGDFEDPCKILYTSGTTGFPKGVVITPKMLFWNSVNTTMSLNITSEDVTVNFLPLFHTGGWNVLLTPFLHRGATVYFLPQFNSQKIIEICELKKVTILFGVPTTLAMISNEEAFKSADFSKLKFLVVGGEAMPLSLIKKWHGKGVYVRQGFGLTECGPNCFSLSEQDAENKIGSIGKPNFYVQTRILNKDFKDAGVDEVGELLLRGPMCMTGYWKNKKATQESFYEGWLKTGDLVRKDREGYFFVSGRKKEMFISGGENVYPVEVENVLNFNPDIQEVAVLGVADEKWGEVGKAFIVPKKGKKPSVEDIIKYCSEHLAKFKIPKHIEFLEELPKGSTGKILKKELQKRI